MSTIQPSQDANISIQLVKGGFILHMNAVDSGFSTEVLTSKGKLMKAVRTFVEANSQVGGKTDEAE